MRNIGFTGHCPLCLSELKKMDDVYVYCLRRNHYKIKADEFNKIWDRHLVTGEDKKERVDDAMALLKELIEANLIKEIKETKVQNE